MHNIAAMRRMNGVQNTSQTPANAQNPGDLSGFMDQIVQALKADPAPTTNTQAAPATPPTVKEVTAKIAEVLQKDGNLPASLQNLTKEELAAKITAALQVGAPTPDANAIRPALTSDLVAMMSTQIQVAEATPETVQKVADILQNNKGISIDALAAMMNQIEPGSGDNKEQLTKIVAQLQAPVIGDNTPVNPAILQQLKDQVAQLLQNGDKINSDDIAKLKTDIVQTLQDQGVGANNIQNYLTALASTLMDSTESKAQLVQAAAITENFQQPLLMQQVAAAKPATAKTAEVSVNVPAQVLSDYESAALAQSISKNLMNQRPMAARTEGRDMPVQQAPTMPGQVAQQAAAAQTQLPQQNVSAKVTGMGMSTEMFATLANSDGSFSSDAGTQGNSQPGFSTDTLGLLKPITVDAAHAKNFANYMADIEKGAPSAMTQMVNVQLQRGITAKTDTMTLHLTPAELGRLDIKLSFDKDGGVKAHMTVEKPETLAMLQKDSHHLQRTLQQSGLDVNDKSLSFDLRQQSQHQQNLEGFAGGYKHGGDGLDNRTNNAIADNVMHAQMAVQSAGYITPTGVNIMV